MLKTASYWLQAAFVRLVLWLVSFLPLPVRCKIVGLLVRAFVRLVPSLAERGHTNLKLIFPNMPAAQRKRLLGDVAANIGQTLTEILFNHEYAKLASDTLIVGPGLQALKEARREGKGAILVSGHFGQWEAVRHALKAHGLESGAMYRTNNNPFYDPIFRAGIEAGGRPIIAKGKAGNRTLLRHIRGGGIMALLVDQYIQVGEMLQFMGQPAVTTLSAAELALRYGIPLVPVFGIREEGGVKVLMEEPIPHSDAPRMMQEFNDRLEAHVRSDPAQWYWLHQRWRAPRYPVTGQ